MSAIIKFEIHDQNYFDSFISLFDEVRRVKNQEFDDTLSDDELEDFDISKLREIIPCDVLPNFDWTKQTLDPSRPISISPAGWYLGEKWNFENLIYLIEQSEYVMVDCIKVEPNVGELKVEPLAYPYGGINPLIGLVEGFGFTVIEYNE